MVQKVEKGSCQLERKLGQGLARRHAWWATAGAVESDDAREQWFFTSGAFLCLNSLMRPPWLYPLKI